MVAPEQGGLLRLLSFGVVGAALAGDAVARIGRQLARGGGAAWPVARTAVQCGQRTVATRRTMTYPSQAPANDVRLALIINCAMRDNQSPAPLANRTPSEVGLLHPLTTHDLVAARAVWRVCGVMYAPHAIDRQIRLAIE